MRKHYLDIYRISHATLVGVFGKESYSIFRWSIFYLLGATIFRWTCIPHVICASYLSRFLKIRFLKIQNELSVRRICSPFRRTREKLVEECERVVEIPLLHCAPSRRLWRWSGNLLDQLLLLTVSSFEVSEKSKDAILPDVWAVVLCGYTQPWTCFCRVKAITRTVIQKSSSHLSNADDHR